MLYYYCLCLREAHSYNNAILTNNYRQLIWTNYTGMNVLVKPGEMVEVVWPPRLVLSFKCNTSQWRRNVGRIDAEREGMFFVVVFQKLAPFCSFYSLYKPWILTSGPLTPQGIKKDSVGSWSSSFIEHSKALKHGEVFHSELKDMSLDLRPTKPLKGCVLYSISPHVVLL